MNPRKSLVVAPKLAKGCTCGVYAVPQSISEEEFLEKQEDGTLCARCLRVLKPHIEKEHLVLDDGDSSVVCLAVERTGEIIATFQGRHARHYAERIVRAVRKELRHEQNAEAVAMLDEMAARRLWRCKHCSERVSDKYDRCPGCNSKRSMDATVESVLSQQPGYWECPSHYCKTMNPGSRVTCKNCNQTRV